MLTATHHLSALSHPLSLCLMSCRFSRICCTESLGPSKNLSLASMLHLRFWAKFFLMVLLLAGRDSYGTESKEADTEADKRSRRDKNQAMSQNVLRSLSTVG